MLQFARSRANRGRTRPANSVEFPRFAKETDTRAPFECVTAEPERPCHDYWQAAFLDAESPVRWPMPTATRTFADTIADSAAQASPPPCDGAIRACL